MRCRLAFSSPTRDSHVLEPLLRRCRECGFDGMQLHPRQYQTFLGEPAGFLGRWSEWTPLLCGMFLRCNVRQEKGRAHVETVIDLAVGIDGDLLVLCCDGPMLSGDRAAPAIVQLEALGRTARGMGLRLSVCNHVDGLFVSRPDLETLAASVDPDVLGLTLDTAQLVLAGETDIASIVRDIPSHVQNIHLTDLRQSRFPMLDDGRVEPCRLGEGDIDFQPLFQTLKEIDYAGWLTVVEPADAADPTDSMNHAAAFLHHAGARE